MLKKYQNTAVTQARPLSAIPKESTNRCEATETYVAPGPGKRCREMRTQHMWASSKMLGFKTSSWLRGSTTRAPLMDAPAS